ncbi:hypothetical protein TWF506_004460 [Arthrobotrys conoides]|uniref:C3H1-type domain-containing protein n=1 Tax=Arthrobotrys conoides TaxID=74498 RepID=A0AAN8RID1_9PEZI
MSHVPRDIRNAMATTLCAIMRARGSCQVPNCMYSHEKRKFNCPSELETGSCKNAYCRYRHQRDGNGKALQEGQTGYRAPQQAADSKQPIQRGGIILPATRPGNPTAVGSALAHKPESQNMAPPKAPLRGPPPAPPPAITRWNAPDPICSNQAERDMVSLFRHPIRCPLELSDLERRQMMDYATKLLNHHKPQFRRYAVREMSEPLAHTHFLDITNILMNDETGNNTFGVIIFLTRFVPLARLLGQPYWETDEAVRAIFKKMLDNVLPSKLYNIYLIARGVASFIGFQGSDNDDIEWPSLFIDMLHCFLNMAKFSKNHGETVGFSACDYWLICFIEQSCDAWFDSPVLVESPAMNVTPRPPKEVVFDELAELVSLYNLSRFFAPNSYLKGERRHLDDVRRLECPDWVQTGTCAGETDDSCFFSHRPRLVDKHVEKSDKKFKSMELWSKFGSRREIVTIQDLTAYWDQALEFLTEGKVDFIFESLMRKEGNFLIEKTLKLRTPDGRDLSCDAIRSFAKIIADPRLEAYNQKESKVVTIADVLVENQKFFVVWTNDIQDGLKVVADSKLHIEAAKLTIGPARFMLNLSPINKLEKETKTALTELCRIIAWHSSEGDVSMAEANAVAERLGLLIRKNLLEERVEFIDRDAPDQDSINYDDAVSLVFSDDTEKANDDSSKTVQQIPAILDTSVVQQTSTTRNPTARTFYGDLIDPEPIQKQSTPQPLHSDLADLLKSGPINFQNNQKENIRAEAAATTAAEQKPVEKTPAQDKSAQVAPRQALAVIETPIQPTVPVAISQEEKTAVVTEGPEKQDDETESQPEDRGPSPNSIFGAVSSHTLDYAIHSLADFFEFGLVRPAARLTEMEANGTFTALRRFFTDEHTHIFPADPAEDISIFSHLFPVLQIISHKLVKHDLDEEIGWKNIMGALFRKLWGPGEFVEFFRNTLRDFYLLHEERTRFSSGHRKLYRKATENMFRLLLGLAKTNQLPRVDGSFQHLLLRFLRIFSEEYRPTLTLMPPGAGHAGMSTPSGSSATGPARVSHDPQSYHRWSKVHALMNILIGKMGLGAFFKLVPGEVGRDPQPRPLFKHGTSFVCPDQKLSTCEFAVHCQFAHVPEDASSPDENGSLESDSGVDTDSDSGTERGEETFFQAASRARLQRGSVVSASGDESAISRHSMHSSSTIIDPMDIAYI